LKLLLALLIATAMLVPIRASAATEWMLEFTTYNPYSTQVVAGPFGTSSECYAVLNQESYVQGGSYSCRIIYY
jgi:hypothetical protein